MAYASWCHWNRGRTQRKAATINQLACPSNSLYVQLLWYPTHYPGGMKARISPVQLSRSHSILAPTQDSNPVGRIQSHKRRPLHYHCTQEETYSVSSWIVRGWLIFLYVRPRTNRAAIIACVLADILKQIYVHIFGGHLGRHLGNHAIVVIDFYIFELYVIRFIGIDNSFVCVSKIRAIMNSIPNFDGHVGRHLDKTNLYWLSYSWRNIVLDHSYPANTDEYSNISMKIGYFKQL